MSYTPIDALVFQGDVDADGYTIRDLNLSGLNLDKSDVGLGNVDNTADVDKPLSGAMYTALALKENSIDYGAANQFWTGLKAWQTFGVLATQSNNTTLSLLSVIGLASNSNAVIAAKRSDYNTSSSHVQTAIEQLGASVTGSILTGLPAANCGILSFTGTSAGVIKTGNVAPIIFGVNNVMRMRLETGLNVGGDTDPGQGCITAFGTIDAGISMTSVTFAASDIITSDTLNVGNSFKVLNTFEGKELSFDGPVVKLTDIPTADPEVVGQIWANSGVLTVSAG